MEFEWLDQLFFTVSQFVANYIPGTIYSHAFSVQALVALILVSIVCGSVGSLVVGNRMAFFSDALAHCAFAGVGLGLFLGFVTGAEKDWFSTWLTPIMVLFGILMGLGIALVREKTSQANDTVIGVFFAGAIGLGAIFLKAAARRRYIQPENFLFGHPAFVKPWDIIELFLLTVGACIVLWFVYNDLVFASFNASLARSRGIRVRFLSYLFIVLLALIVNICLKTIGVLLINALLIVPAAAAANLCRNMRQLFPCAISLCLLASVLGQNISWEVANRTEQAFGPDGQFVPGETGTIVVVTVLFYFLSIFFGSYVKNRSQGSLPSPEKSLQT